MHGTPLYGLSFSELFGIIKFFCYFCSVIKNKSIYFICILFVLMNNSCRNNSKLSFSQDFEQMAGWEQTPTLVKEKGHSGLYFTRTGLEYEFSKSFALRLGDISTEKVRRIDMGAWIRISEPAAKAKLVLSIESGDSAVFWQAIDTESASPKPGEWTRLYFTFDLPDDFQPDYVVKMYLWNVSKKTVDADDFDIHFYTK